MGTAWTRPYRAGSGRWLVIAWELGALTYLHWTSVSLFHLGDGPARVLAAVFVALWIGAAWRIVRMGVYLGDAGLRVRGLMRTRTVPWSHVETITVEQIVHRFAGWTVPGGRSVIVALCDGGRVNTELWEHGMDFHGRPELFRSIYSQLRERHGMARRPAVR